MRKIVVIAATEIEIAGCRVAVPDCEFVVSGMGAANAAIATICAIEKYKPQLIIQMGIAGAIDKSLNLGEVVFVEQDFQADLGAWRENEQRFESFSTPVIRIENSTRWHGVKAQSVNTACVPYILDSDAQIESMEGAAFFQAASKYEGLSFMQIRSISNYVDTPRSEWQIPMAIDVLAETLREIVDSAFFLNN